MTNHKVLAVFHMHQLAAVAAGDVGHGKMFYRLVFRVVVVIGAARQPDTDPPVDFAVSTVDMVNHVVRDEQVAIVNRHVPLNGVPLQIAETAVGNTRPVDLIVKALAQNGVVGLGHRNIINDQVTHDPLLFAADIDLRHRPVAAHRYALDSAVRAAHVESDVIEVSALFPTYPTAILQYKAPPAVALERPAY